MINTDWIDYTEFLPLLGLKAGFSKAGFSDSIDNARIKLCDVMDLNSDILAYPEQIHSSNVANSSEPGFYEQADGLICAADHLVLSVKIADCIPIYLVDITTGVFGLLHAGWRGIKAGIIQSGIEKFAEIGGSERGIHAFLGPSIRNCCFIVGEDVAAFFPRDFVSVKNDKLTVDLQGVVSQQLMSSGVRPSNIEDAEKCNCCSSDFYSYRRQGKKAGRMIAIIGRSN
jgi:YfiH family protein